MQGCNPGRYAGAIYDRVKGRLRWGRPFFFSLTAKEKFTVIITVVWVWITIAGATALLTLLIL